ncbi:hypothetical protein [uncultured Hymenobacter sp.]|uniref:hypothetical protein n=1 Tax=uncultured Hymenobacter sp. TaxID=170016 RepID=UPI0035CA7EFB
MSPQVPIAYQALREYLNQLLTVVQDRAWEEVPALLHPHLTHFMRGQTVYEDPATGRTMIYGRDLAGWASELLYGAGLPQPLPLTPLDAAGLQAAARS